MLENENRDITIRDLNYRLEAEKRVVTAYDKILMGLVRNTDYKSNMMGSVAMAGNTGNGGYPVSVPTSEVVSNTAE